MAHSKYWKGYEELNNDPEFNKNKQKEFVDELPMLNDLKHLTTEQQASRRDFLKVLGFGVSAAAIAASCEIPIKKAIPYVVKPEEVTPGIPTYYASTIANGSDYCSVLVKTREGRPIKIEGNEMSGITQGATNARAQGAVVSLYDGARLPYPKKDGKKASWEDIDKAVSEQLAGARGDIAILTGSVLSPSVRQIIADFKAKYPNTRHVEYEPVSNAGIMAANEAKFGKKAVPGYDFSKAEVIVSLGADFLGTWVSPLEFAKQYVKNRKVDKDHPSMSKHWQFESYLSITGAKADKRFTVKPSQEGLAAVALYNALTGGTEINLGDKVNAAIAEAASDLKKHQGKSLVVSGSNDANVQAVVNAINEAVGSYGNAIDIKHAYTLGGDDQAMAQLVNDMNGGRIGAVIMCDTNPAYSYHDVEGFKAALAKVPTRIACSDREDETASLANFLCPSNHFLESWGDAEPKSGYYSLCQPTIAPLFDTRQAAESLLTWAGIDTSVYNYIKAYWEKNIFPKSGYSNFRAFWDAALHDGIFESNNPSKTSGNGVAAMYKKTGNIPALEVEGLEETTEKIVAAVVPAGTAPKHDDHDEGHADDHSDDGGVLSGGNVSGAISAIQAKTDGAGDGLEVKLFEGTVMGNGKYAANPFLQETPDPITKVCWTNVLMVNRQYAEEQGWREGDIVEITANGKSIQAPVVHQPGQAHGTASIALGYGRTMSGIQQCNGGANAYSLLGFNGKTFDYELTSGVTASKVGGGYELARTQTHHTVYDTGTMGNERPIIREAALEEYKHDKYAGNHVKQHFEEHKDIHHFTLYGEDDTYGPHAEAQEQGHHWGMAIDLNACIGCGACVTACNIENNVPVVGEGEVFRAHEMHWMRIDRYYSEDEENPDVTFMPMMCQHCDNAPCENVCPVAATNHSSEGLNQMAYNRCIGTRYCANNCPYKVRRFNWFDYQSADSFYERTIFDNDEYAMMDDLTRMVLNPDVTVRSRGVMEKCSFCVQRLQTGKLEAKKAGRPLKDGEVKTACQQGCPTNAIVFGDTNNPESEVSKVWKNERSYFLLEAIHVLPSVAYMTQIRNREGSGEHGDDHGHGH